MYNMNQESIKRPRLLTLREAADLIEGLTEYRVKMLCINKHIKHHKFGNKYMIPEHELLKYFGVSA